MSGKAQSNLAGLVAAILLVAGFFIGSVVGARLIAYTYTVVTTNSVTERLTQTVYETRTLTTPTTLLRTTTIPTNVTSRELYTTTLVLTTTTTEQTTVSINHTVANTTLTVTKTNTTTTTKTISQIELVCFSRTQYCLADIINHVKQAKTYIYVMAYLITSDDIADALIDAHNKGVNVKIVLEKDMMNISGSEYKKLRDAGIDVRVENTSYLLHHKVIIVDGKVVVTGSYNFSRAAEDENYENLLIITDPKIVSEYEQEFGRVLQNSVIPPPSP
ncbi:MAG: phospholipase D family protein [Nitrososphaerota archaeon]